MTREEYNAELEAYQQMEAEKEQLKKEKDKDYDRFYSAEGAAPEFFRPSKEAEEKNFMKNPNKYKATSWSSASINYRKKLLKLTQLKKKMEQSRKRLANYKGA